MKILSWNVRGLGRSSKCHFVKEFILSSHADILCLQESKLQEIHISTWKSIGGSRLNTFDFILAIGSAGGIILAWDSSQVVGTLLHKRSFSITLEFTNQSDNTIWACTGVYGPSSRPLKDDFRNELRTIGNLHSLPWVICGDFNLQFTSNDKNKGDLHAREIVTSQNLLNDLNLVDPPLHGRRFTWSNGQADSTWVRLDRFLYSHNWTQLFPRSIQSALPRIGSNHSPICLDFGNHLFRPRIFHLDKSWYSNPQLENLIQDWWSAPNLFGCGAFILSKKLLLLKRNLRSWAKENITSLNILKLNLLDELNSLDTANECRDLTAVESDRLSLIRSELSNKLKQEEIYWKQRSRITWLKEGDCNTKFFHMMANGRRNKNFIHRIRHNGQWIEGNSEIGKVFSDHFQSVFGTPLSRRFLLDWTHLFNYKARIDLSSLEIPFTTEEIQRAVFDLNADKAPGPDGFPIFFYQKHWNLLREDIFKLCNDFYGGTINYERINWVHLALIAKTSAPTEASDFRPISLINSTCKIISKILSSIRSLVIGELVDDSQSGFIKGRYIADNIIAAQD
ncbi:RNA-directed DNA polymerase protein [Dioscorea alata]|uniref:RNA-directed DNA polymerase protein n=1 Tax=Dioscorea alata TaxID=55571 RepID=A0ACB7W9J7_DIOAL|nr:RNA-directed DNA polymerase protein [Dioscorea alata]